MKGALLRYRVMAYLVGFFLIILVVIGLPLKYLTPDGSTAEDIGQWITEYLGILHGWLYMIFLVTAAFLARKAKWDVAFSITTLLMGTIPFLSFWAEHRANLKVRADFPADFLPASGANSSL